MFDRDRVMSTAPPPAWGAPQPPPWPPTPAVGPPAKRSPLLVALAVTAGVILVAVAAVAGAWVGGRRAATSSTGATSPATSAPATTPARVAQAAALYQQAVRATQAAIGFHYVSDVGGPQTQQIIGDAGPSGGTQVITDNSTFGAEQFTLLLVGGMVYFQGNAPALRDQLGVPAASAPALAGKWVSVATPDGPYRVVAPGITTADQALELSLVPTSTSSVTLAGAPATRIEGALPPQQGLSGSRAHLDVDPISHHPLTYVTAASVSGANVTSTTTFTAWGTAPTVTAPAGAVAWSTLGASAPPGGYGNGGSTPGSPSTST